MIQMNKLELGIKKARQLFKEYAKDNYLDLVEESKHEEYYENEEYIDYQDMGYLRMFVQDNAELSLNDMLDQLYENYIAYDSDIIGTEYYRENFLNEYDEQLRALFSETEYEDNHESLFLDDYISIRNTVDYASALEGIEVDVLVYLENEDAFDREMSNNDFFNIFYSEDDSDELLEMLSESSLKLLLQSQGYNLKDFVWFYLADQDELNSVSDQEKFSELNDDKVFMSIYSEVFNAQNLQSLVVPTQMTIKEIEHVKNADSYTVDKDSTIGYFGAIDGSGSMIEIDLNKDIELSKGEFKVVVDGQYGYSMSDVYGQFMN